MTAPTAMPAPSPIGVRTRGEPKMGCVIGMLVRDGKEVPIMTINHQVMDANPWLLNRMQLILQELAARILAAEGFTSEFHQQAEQIGAVVDAQPESLIVLDPIEEAKRKH